MSEEIPFDPHDINAEEAVNGSLLIDGSHMAAIYNVLKPADFYNEANRDIYTACRALYDRDTAIDQITLAQELDRAGRLDSSGGAAYLSHLISVVPTSLDIEHYAEIVSRLAEMRDVIHVGRKIQDIGRAASPDREESLVKVSELVDNLKKGRGGHHIVTPHERFDKAFDRYHALANAEVGIATKTGLLDLDRILGGGLFPGASHILAGRPGMGKSALAQTITNNSSRQGPVLVASGEMTVDDWSDRDVAGYTRRSIDDIRYGHYEDDLFEDIMKKALPAIADSNVYYMAKDRRYAFNTSNVYHAAYSLQEREGLVLLVIDYLSLLKDRYGSGETERVGYLSGRVKEMALDLNVPVLCLHQLNRAVDTDSQRKDHIPKLTDLRDSGAVEQDADVVMFLHRKSYYDHETEDDEATVILAKKRQGQGRRGKYCKLVWNEAGQAYETKPSQREFGEGGQTDAG